MSNRGVPAERQPKTNQEIDIVDLMAALFAEKYIILGILVFSLVFSAVAIHFMTPVYKATADVLAPLERDLLEINKLNISQENSMRVTPKNVFKQYIDTLNSRALKKELFFHHNLIDYYMPNAGELPTNQKSIALETALDRFSKNFLIFPAKTNTDDEPMKATVSFSMKGLQPSQVAAILNDWVSMADQNTIKQMHEHVVAGRQYQLDQINNHIAALRKTATHRRLDKVAQLDEAIMVLRKLHLPEPFMRPPIEEQSASNQNLTLLSLGYNILETKKEILLNRENEDPFIDGLRDLQAEIARLEALKINPDLFRVVRVERPAFPPAAPETPKPILILAVSGVFGLMTGVIVALIIRTFRQRRSRSLSEITT